MSITLKTIGFWDISDIAGCFQNIIKIGVVANIYLWYSVYRIQIKKIKKLAQGGNYFFSNNCIQNT